jgi:hypothetical protein
MFHRPTVSYVLSQLQLQLNNTYLDNGKRSRRRRVAGSFYWEGDIRKIGSEWERYQRAASEEKPGAQQTFDAWKKYRKDIVASHTKVTFFSL